MRERNLNLEKIRSIVYINALLDLGEYTDKDAYEYELDTDNECYGTSYWFTDEESAYDTLSALLAEPLQKIYVESYGSAEDRKKLELLCRDVIDTYRETSVVQDRVELGGSFTIPPRTVFVLEAFPILGEH